MLQYIILCTPEQTRKALELGAHPEFVTSQREQDSRYDYIKSNLSMSSFENTRYINVAREYDKNDKYVVFNKEVYRCPTAEQMIGWLEGQGDIEEINISHIYGDWTVNIHLKTKACIGDYNFYPSRREATLAAIDAALEYLTEHNSIK